MNCVHKSPKGVRHRRRGQSITVSKCSLRGRCVPTVDDLAAIKTTGVVACEGCPLFAIAQGDWLTCGKRGEAVALLDGVSGCGCDKSIYQCSLNGKCLKRLPTGTTRHKLGDQLDGVTVCKTECQEWRVRD